MRQIYRGINQDIVQEMNRSLILRLLREEKMCSRVHLSKLSNLKQATVTNIVADFIRWGLVKEVGFLSGSKGRRSIGIEINTDRYSVIGVRLARRYFSVGLFDLAGNPDEIRRVDTASGQAPQEVFALIQREIAALLERRGERRVLALGMAIPGPFIRQKGRIALMTENMGWNNIPIKEELEEKFQLPVFLEHDANAGAIAQLWHSRDARHIDGLIYVAAGQGIGAGIVANGQVLKGVIGIAGEIGHTTIDFDGPECACGNRGCLEKYCSSIALTKAVNELRPGEAPLDFHQIRERVAQGDTLCVQEFERACGMLAVGIVNLVNAFNPQLVIVGDEMAHVAPARMLGVLQEAVEGRVLPEVYSNMKICISEIPNDSILNGAGIVAVSEIYSDPHAFVGVEA